MKLRKLFCGVLSVGLSVPMLAQSSPSSEAAPAAPAHHQHMLGAPRPQSHQAPCWKKAGISPDLVNQKWNIEEKDREKTAAICSDAALSPEQKKDKIAQADKVRDAEIAKLIPAQQLDTYKACWSQRQMLRAKTTSVELGPCGGVIPNAPGSAQHTHASTGSGK